MRLFPLLTVLAVAAPLCVHARDLNLVVAPVADGEFTVQYRAPAILADYWCAAAKHVLHTLGQPTRTRIYRQSAQAPEQAGGIRFTLDPARSAGATGFQRAGGRSNGSLTAGWAYEQHCGIRRSIRDN